MDRLSISRYSRRYSCRCHPRHEVSHVSHIFLYNIIRSRWSRWISKWRHISNSNTLSTLECRTSNSTATIRASRAKTTKFLASNTTNTLSSNRKTNLAHQDKINNLRLLMVKMRVKRNQDHTEKDRTTSIVTPFRALLSLRKKTPTILCSMILKRSRSLSMVKKTRTKPRIRKIALKHILPKFARQFPSHNMFICKIISIWLVSSICIRRNNPKLTRGHKRKRVSFGT